MLLTGLQYQSAPVTLIRFRHVREGEASFIRIRPHNGACFHVENSTRLLLIRYFNHLLCSTFGPTVPLWRVIKRLEVHQGANIHDIVQERLRWFQEEGYRKWGQESDPQTAKDDLCPLSPPNNTLCSQPGSMINKTHPKHGGLCRPQGESQVPWASEERASRSVLRQLQAWLPSSLRAGAPVCSWFLKCGQSPSLFSVIWDSEEKGKFLF